MSPIVDIDALWSAFCDSLPPEPRREAPHLPAWLGLAPLSSIPLSGIFKHEITLAAPALFGAAMPSVHPSRVRTAVLAHLLAVLEAFASDRIADGQVPPTARLEQLLDHIRDARDRALSTLDQSISSAYWEAERRSRAAAITEHQLLSEHTRMSFADYHCLSLAKQGAAFPATLALARMAGWDRARRRAAVRVLEGVVLGLQFHDDVVDWEDDWTRGNAWPISLGLSHCAPSRCSDPGTDLVNARRVLTDSGILAHMLAAARRHFHASARIAHWLGADRLSTWARQEELRLEGLVEGERKSAGYAVRAHQLNGWAMEVLT